MPDAEKFGKEYGDSPQSAKPLDTLTHLTLPCANKSRSEFFGQATKPYNAVFLILQHVRSARKVAETLMLVYSTAFRGEAWLGTSLAQNFLRLYILHDQNASIYKHPVFCICRNAYTPARKLQSLIVCTIHAADVAKATFSAYRLPGSNQFDSKVWQNKRKRLSVRMLEAVWLCVNKINIPSEKAKMHFRLYLTNLPAVKLRTTCPSQHWHRQSRSWQACLILPAALRGSLGVLDTIRNTAFQTYMKRDGKSTIPGATLASNVRRPNTPGPS